MIEMDPQSLPFPNDRKTRDLAIDNWSPDLVSRYDHNLYPSINTALLKQLVDSCRMDNRMLTTKRPKDCIPFNVNQNTSYGFYRELSLLHLSVMFGNIEAIQILAAAGANLNILNGQLDSPVSLCRKLYGWRVNGPRGAFVIHAMDELMKYGAT